MHRCTLPLIAVSLCFATAVRADTPASASPAEARATATVTNAAPAAATPAPSSAAAANAPSAATSAKASADDVRPESVGGLTDAQVKRAFAKFRKQQRDGETLYCRKETPLGSRLGKTICYTEDQVLANARAERDAGQMQSQQNVCGIGSCSPTGD